MPHARASDGTMIGYDVTGTGEPLLLIAGQANSRHSGTPSAPAVRDFLRRHPLAR